MKADLDTFTAWPNAGIGTETIKTVRALAETYKGRDALSTEIGKNMLETFCQRLQGFIALTGDDSRALFEAGRLIKNVTSGCYILSRDGFDDFYDDMLNAWKAEFCFSPLLDRGEEYPKLYDGEAPICLSDNAHDAYTFLADSGITFGRDGNFRNVVWRTPLFRIAEVIRGYKDVSTPLTPGYDSVLRAMQKKARSAKMILKNGIVSHGIKHALERYVGNLPEIYDYKSPELQMVIKSGEQTCRLAIREAKNHVLDHELGILLMCADYGRRLLGYRFIPDTDPDNGEVALLMNVLLDKGKNPAYLNESSKLLNPNLSSYVRLLRLYGCYNPKKRDIMSLDMSIQGCERLTKWLKQWDDILVFITETRVTEPEIVAGWARKAPFFSSTWEEFFIITQMP